MFPLTKEEFDVLLLQTARAKTGRGGRQTLPCAFTEHGVAMLSSVLNTDRAVQMNIVILWGQAFWPAAGILPGVLRRFRRTPAEKPAAG
jgi:hypothetical protein